MGNEHYQDGYLAAVTVSSLLRLKVGFAVSNLILPTWPVCR